MTRNDILLKVDELYNAIIEGSDDKAIEIMDVIRNELTR